MIGIDYSQSFVDACDRLKHDGKIEYSIVEEGDLTSNHVARVPTDIVSKATCLYLGQSLRII